MCMVNVGKYTSPMDPIGLFIMMPEMMSTLDLLRSIWIYKLFKDKVYKLSSHSILEGT